MLSLFHSFCLLIFSAQIFCFTNFCPCIVNFQLKLFNLFIKFLRLILNLLFSLIFLEIYWYHIGIFRFIRAWRNLYFSLYRTGIFWLIDQLWGRCLNRFIARSFWIIWKFLNVDLVSKIIKFVLIIVIFLLRKRDLDSTFWPGCLSSLTHRII